jgi:hypothetical protein
MNLIEIIRAQGVGTQEPVVPGESVIVKPGDRIICDIPITEVSSIARIDEDLEIIVGTLSPTTFKEFFSSSAGAIQSVIQFQDKTFMVDDLKEILTIRLTSTDASDQEHHFFLSPGSSIIALPGNIFHLNAQEFEVKDLHRHGNDLHIQSHDEEGTLSAILSGFFIKPVEGAEPPQLKITDQKLGADKDMIVHPRSAVFQWEGEPLPQAIVGAMYGYYFHLEGQDTENFRLIAKTSEGPLPVWLTFSDLGKGKYFLSGMPTRETVGSYEIAILAQSTQQGVGVHTLQTFLLQVRPTNDVSTRPAAEDVAAAEFRKASGDVTAESYAAAMVSIDQVAYMTMSEIAAVTSLVALDPVSFRQQFSNYATPYQTQIEKGLSEQSILGNASELHPLDAATPYVEEGADTATVPKYLRDLVPVQVEPYSQTSQTSDTSTSTSTTSSEPPTNSPPSDTTDPSNITPPAAPLTPTNDTTVPHQLLIISPPPPPPPPPSGPLFIDLNSPFNGFTLVGNDPGDRSGRDATIVADVTGDGIGDLLVGVQSDAPNYGEAYLIPGSTTGFPATFHIATPGVNGTIFSPPFNFQTYQVYSIGDFNGDGLNDMLITPNYKFSAYIIFGHNGGFSPSVDLSSLVSSGGGIEINAGFGRFTDGSYLGDVNGDGLADIIIGSGGTRGFYVFFGTTTPPTILDVSTLNGTNGFGIHASTGHGSFLGMTGVDINGDGFNDIFVNTFESTPYNEQIAVVLGKPAGFPTGIDPSTLTPGQGFFIFDSAATGFYNGFGVRMDANIGDVNHDGLDDVLFIQKNKGNAFVIFGSTSFTSATSIDVQSLNGTNGFKLTSATYDYMTKVSYAGDVNGDGISDFIIADTFSYGGKGAAHVIFGGATGFPASIDLHNLLPNQGFTILGATGSQLYSVGGGQDLNGDGLADIVVSSHIDNSGAGATYVIYGANFNGVITLMGTPGNDTLTGTAGNDVIYAGAGNDIINALGGNDFIDAGVGGADRIDAGQGNDTIVYYLDDAPVIGGTGTDTIWFKNDNTHVNFIGATNYTGIDVIDLKPLQTLNGNSVTLNAATVLSMSDANVMTINGDAHDSLQLSPGDLWTTSYVLTGYTTYTSASGSIVNVENGIHVNNMLFSYIDDLRGIALDSGAIENNNLGWGVTLSPDINGDGFDELLVANRNGYAVMPKAEIVFGQATFPSAHIHVTDPGIVGTEFFTGPNFLGGFVAGAHDFNGDGHNDILIAPLYSHHAYIVYGNPSGFTPTVNLPALGSAGLDIYSSVPLFTSGFTTGTNIGDVNGDGLADIALNNGNSGFGYVVFGSLTPHTSLDVTTLNGADGFKFITTGWSGNSNSATLMAADINGDGFADIFSRTFSSITNQETVSVILGHSTAFPATIDTATLAPGTGFHIYNSAAFSGYGALGKSMTNIGDFNGSGMNAIAVHGSSTFAANTNSINNAVVYVIFGDPAFSSSGNFNVTTLNGTNGFGLVAPTQSFSYITSIASVGDVNGDGLADFAFIDGSAYGTGALFVIFGSQNPMPQLIDYTHLTPKQGIAFQFGGNYGGAFVGGGGDINGDGLADIVVGNPFTSPGGSSAAGSSYIIFGGNFTHSITQMGTAGNDIITATSNDEVIYAGAGNDVVTVLGGSNFIDGGAGADSIIGAAGADTIVFDAHDTIVNGGAGTDTLWFKADSTVADLRGTSVYTGMDVINLRAITSLYGNEVKLDAATVLSMSDANVMTIKGDAHDILGLTATDSWATSAVISGYTTFTSLSGSVINVANAVHVVYVPPVTPVSLNFTLSTLMDGVRGFDLTPIIVEPNGYAATSSTIVPNGDGFDSLLIANGFVAGGSPFARAFLIEGQAAFPASTPFNGGAVTLKTFNNDSFGYPIAAYGQHVNSMGDFNGDGFNDILISEFFGVPSHIVLGGASGFAATTLLSTSSIQLSGNESSTSAALGDVQGDGLGDIALSNASTGWGAVIFGTTSPGSDINMMTLNGTDGFQIARPSSSFVAGTQTVAGADITGDGKNDILVSYYDTGTHVGGIGVILGSSTFSSTVTVSSSGIAGASGFLITNSAGILGNNFLINPTNIGDFSKDGIDDIAFSSKDTVYVVFGTPAFSSLDVATLNGTNGFELTAVGSHNIENITQLGDVNGDGISDFAFFDSSGLGAFYVIFGTHTPVAANIDYTNLTSNQGFAITDTFGFSHNNTVAGIIGDPSVSGGGDLNGDGLDDIVITSGSHQYVVFGGNFNGVITQIGDVNHSVIQGEGANDVIYAGAGNQTINGGSGTTFIDGGQGQDIINGGAGMNTIVFDAQDTLVHAGSGGLGAGPNTLWIRDDGTLANLQDTVIFKEFDVINLKSLQSLTGNGVVLDPLGVNNMSHHDKLVVNGGAHDSLILHNTGADVWTAGAPVLGGTIEGGIAGHSYVPYTSTSGATVYGEDTLHIPPPV